MKIFLSFFIFIFLLMSCSKSDPLDKNFQAYIEADQAEREYRGVVATIGEKYQLDSLDFNENTQMDHTLSSEEKILELISKLTNFEWQDFYQSKSYPLLYKTFKDACDSGFISSYHAFSALQEYEMNHQKESVTIIDLFEFHRFLVAKLAGDEFSEGAEVEVRDHLKDYMTSEDMLKHSLLANMLRISLFDEMIEQGLIAEKYRAKTHALEDFFNNHHKVNLYYLPDDNLWKKIWASWSCDEQIRKMGREFEANKKIASEFKQISDQAFSE